MAPELALAAISEVSAPGLVLDPMCGSGTVLHAAASAGFDALGFDLDPLAVLMSKVWTTPVDTGLIVPAAQALVRESLADGSAGVELSWIDDDAETTAFINYWFAAAQRDDLRLLAAALRSKTGPMADILRLVLSRLIVTKDRGASLARDVSHSRPHRVTLTNDFDVMRGFVRAAGQISQRLGLSNLRGSASVALGDARLLDRVADDSVALVVTSPPYLNAIDYLRGHRLALVWMGHTLSDLRKIRGESIGSERGLSQPAHAILEELLSAVPVEQLDRRFGRILERYAHDLHQATFEIARTLQPGGQVVFVVGNSTVRGVFVDNASITQAAAEAAGLELRTRAERDLPSSRRYLPPPSQDGPGLHRRMRTEVVLRMQKAA
jgi:hypothetical protein